MAQVHQPHWCLLGAAALLLALVGCESSGSDDGSVESGGSARAGAAPEAGGTSPAPGSGGASAGLGRGGQSSNAGAGGVAEAATGGSAGSGGNLIGGSVGSGGSAPGGSVGSGGSATGGSGNVGASGAAPGTGLGAYPVDSSPMTQGGTITFTNIGAPGWWPRRLDRPSGDPACDYKDGEDTWGGHCCMTQHATTSDQLAPFDEEMTLIMKAIDVRQLAVYQPQATGGPDWRMVSSWDARDGVATNFWFTQSGEGSSQFPGDLTGDDCVWYLMQEPVFECATAEYYCPDDPGINHLGWAGSKLIVFLASLTFDDAGVLACGATDPGHPGPWVAFVASELVRDGGRKWNGLCNCYSATGSVGDGCGEINVFEVVMDNNEYSNRDFISTGVRSFQAGHVGGSVCGADCDWNAFAADSDVVDACSQAAYTSGPVIEADGASDGCPVWRRPAGDRYLMILLDETRRTIQVAIIHPENIPSGATALLPDLPLALSRTSIDALVDLRLPN